MPEFRGFPKIPRLFRDVVITEKIDGTNACVVVTEDGTVYAQSRKRLITPESDNYGFAAWVRDHSLHLRELGPGYHYGEWYGKGIQRGYGMEERRFALFNAKRWGDSDVRPSCCDVVPMLAIRVFSEDVIRMCLMNLVLHGSQAAGAVDYGSPEGIVVYHAASNNLYKVLLENDDLPKSMAV